MIDPTHSTVSSNSYESSWCYKHHSQEKDTLLGSGHLITERHVILYIDSLVMKVRLWIWDSSHEEAYNRIQRLVIVTIYLIVLVHQDRSKVGCATVTEAPGCSGCIPFLVPLANSLSIHVPRSFSLSTLLHHSICQVVRFPLLTLPESRIRWYISEMGAFLAVL